MTLDPIMQDLSDTRLCMYGSQIILENITKKEKSGSNVYYSYLSSLEDNTQGYVVKVEFKNYNQSSNTYISIYDAGKISDGTAINKKQFEQIQNNQANDRLVFAFGCKLKEDIIKTWKDFIIKSQESNNIEFPWMSILSTVILKSLKTIVNNNFEMQYCKLNNASRYTKWNTASLQKMYVNSKLSSDTLNHKDNFQVEIDKIVESAFHSANYLYQVFKESIDKNNISLKNATKQVKDKKEYWTQELKNSISNSEKGPLFDKTVNFSREMIGVSEALHAIMDKISKKSEEGVELLNKTRFNGYDDESRIKLKASFVSMQKAVMASRSIYAECLKNVADIFKQIEDSMKMFGVYEFDRFAEFSKNCEDLLDTCIYSQLCSYFQDKDVNVNQVDIKKEVENIIKEKCQSISDAKIQILTLLALEVKSKISSAMSKIDMIFSTLVNDPEDIKDVEKYITDFMYRIRNHTSFKDLSTGNLLEQTKYTQYMRENIAKFLSKNFGISIFGENSADNSANMQKLIQNHNELVVVKNTPDVMQMHKVFEVLLKERHENQKEEDIKVVIQNGNFCIAKKHITKDTAQEFDKLLLENSFIPKGVEQPAPEEAEKGMIENAWNKAKSFTSGLLGYFYKPSEATDEEKKDKVELKQMYHPGLHNATNNS